MWIPQSSLVLRRAGEPLMSVVEHFAKVARKPTISAIRILNQNRILYMEIVDVDVVAAMVRGDSGSVYKVVVNIRKGRYYCTCPANIRGKLCKHIIAVIIALERKYGIVVRPKPPSSPGSV